MNRLRALLIMTMGCLIAGTLGFAGIGWAQERKTSEEKWLIDESIPHAQMNKISAAEKAVEQAARIEATKEANLNPTVDPLQDPMPQEMFTIENVVDIIEEIQKPE